MSKNEKLSSTFPPIQVGEPDLSICLSAIHNCIGATEANCRIVSEVGHSADCLFRRHARSESGPSLFVDIGKISDFCSGTIGFPGQCGEIGVVSKKKS